jgi:hypothetical protein
MSSIPKPLIEETFAFGLVIGCSLFGILWGTVNALLVSRYFLN